jgi:hypothetical protein
MSTKNWEEARKLTKDDVNIQLGDFGWVWHAMYTNKEQEHFLDQIAGKNWTLAVVPGNHENYDEIEKFPIIEKWGGKVRVLERKSERMPLKKDGSLTKNRYEPGNIYFLERGETYTINDKTFWVMGGALSIDKDHRLIGESYWAQEIPTWQEFNHGMDSLDKVNWEVDYVLTHTCPMNVIPDIIKSSVYMDLKYKDPTAEYLFEIYKKIKFKEWHFGHFHKDVRKDYKGYGVFACHYLNIPCELEQ